MAGEVKLKTQPLIPLEYCTPERAARLFNCETEDIFHWASVGAITIYAQFPDFKYSGGEECFVGDIYINDDLVSYEEYHELELMYDGETIYKKIPLGMGGPINIRPKSLSTNQGFFAFGASMWLQNPGDGYCERTVHLSGFWEVDSESISQMLLPAKGQDDYWYLRATYVVDDMVAEPKTGIGLCSVNVDNMSSRLRVMREDLLKLQRHLSSGEPMGKKTREPWTVLNEHRSHPTAERHSAIREKIYAVAIYAREQWPDECLTATAWAATIDDHAHQLFELGDGQKSPSQDQMARMLGKAMNEGKPYKKN
ncbi:TPA: hypothetical protein ACSP3E_003809 [Aeromonas veronii]